MSECMEPSFRSKCNTDAITFPIKYVKTITKVTFLPIDMMRLKYFSILADVLKTHSRLSQSQ